MTKQNIKSKFSIVECLKCVGHYIEKTEFVECCPHCGNTDKMETVYLTPDGDLYQRLIREVKL